jgi:hypothetical protein
MNIFNKGLFQKIRTEPPVAAAFVTIAFFSLPVLFSLVTTGFIQLPAGYTYTKSVQPVFGLLAIVVDLALVYLFSKSPVVKLYFHSIVTPDFVRKLLIVSYIAITWFSLYTINAKLDFINSLLDDPLITMLKVGTDIVEENLLRSFFLGISGCIAFALIRSDDGIVLRAAGLFTAIAIVIFYFFIGRREISLMTLCFLLLTKRDKIGKGYAIAVGAVLIAILVVVLSLRVSMQDNSDPLYATDSEELSTVGYSAYVVQSATPDIIGSFTQVTPLRAYLYPTTISAAYIKSQTGYSDTAAPVLGIGGVTYMYGFIIPVIMLMMMGCFFRSVTNEFKSKHTPALKLLLIFVTFKAFNFFRNGEFPIVIMDTIKFFLLALPAFYLNFKQRTAINTYE